LGYGEAESLMSALEQVSLLLKSSFVTAILFSILRGQPTMGQWQRNRVSGQLLVLS
jgi:hypothetical protein